MVRLGHRWHDEEVIGYNHYGPDSKRRCRSHTIPSGAINEDSQFALSINKTLILQEHAQSAKYR